MKLEHWEILKDSMERGRPDRRHLATPEDFDPPPRVGAPAPPVSAVLEAPIDGDLLCFCDGRWQVARRGGWAYPVVPERLAP